MANYPLVYSDARGRIESSLGNDGKTLSTVLRGVSFSGGDFDSLTAADADEAARQGFVLNQGDLCNCTLRVVLPLPMNTPDGAVVGELDFTLLLGAPDLKRGSIDREELTATLRWNGMEVESGMCGWFEDALAEIKSKLPEGHTLHICFGCQFSDYSAYGHGVFGGMMCFRNIKSEYLKVVDKVTFWAVHDRFERFRQETDGCSEFEPRQPGTGYRG